MDRCKRLSALQTTTGHGHFFCESRMHHDNWGDRLHHPLPVPRGEHCHVSQQPSMSKHLDTHLPDRGEGVYGRGPPWPLQPSSGCSRPRRPVFLGINQGRAPYYLPSLSTVVIRGQEHMEFKLWWLLLGWSELPQDRVAELLCGLEMGISRLTLNPEFPRFIPSLPLDEHAGIVQQFEQVPCFRRCQTHHLLVVLVHTIFPCHLPVPYLRLGLRCTESQAHELKGMAHARTGHSAIVWDHLYHSADGVWGSLVLSSRADTGSMQSTIILPS